jgi:hypothetical protein
MAFSREEAQVPFRRVDEPTDLGLQPHIQSLQYGGEAFVAASGFLRRFVPWEVPGATQERAPLLGGVKGAVRLLASLPSLPVALSETEAGERLRAHFNHRIWGIPHFRLAQGVLVIPGEDDPPYLAGRSRQAVRTNMRKARAAGITCRPLTDVAERRSAAQRPHSCASWMSKWGEELFGAPGDMWWAAFEPSGAPVTIAQVTVDQEWALLQSFVSTDLASRYLLHTALVEALARANVRYLAVNGEIAPLLDPNLQYWQRLLGYRVANLRLLRAPLSAETPQPIADLDVDRILSPA